MDHEQRNKVMVAAALVVSVAALVAVIALRGRSPGQAESAHAIILPNKPAGTAAPNPARTTPGGHEADIRAAETAAAREQFINTLRANVSKIERLEQQHLDQIVFAVEGFDDVVVQRWGVAMAVRNLEHAKMTDELRTKLRDTLFRAAENPNWKLRRSVAANLTGCKLLEQPAYRDLIMDLRADKQTEVADRAKRTTLPGEPEIR